MVKLSGKEIEKKIEKWPFSKASRYSRNRIFATRCSKWMKKWIRDCRFSRFVDL